MTDSAKTYFSLAKLGNLHTITTCSIPEIWLAVADSPFRTSPDHRYKYTRRIEAKLYLTAVANDDEPALEKYRWLPRGIITFLLVPMPVSRVGELWGRKVKAGPLSIEAAIVKLMHAPMHVQIERGQNNIKVGKTHWREDIWKWKTFSFSTLVTIKMSGSSTRRKFSSASFTDNQQHQKKWIRTPAESLKPDSETGSCVDAYP